MRGQRGLAALALVLLVAACGRAPEPAPVPSAATPTSTPVATPLEPAIRTLELGRAIGPDRRVSEATSSFRPSDTIYVVVLTEGTAPGTQVKARFLYGPEAQLVSESSQSLASQGPSVTEFHIAKPDGWPAGSYAVEVQLDDRAPRRAEFEVK